MSAPVNATAVAALGRVHFLGIGGVGVSGVARIMLQQGVEVSGTDAKDLPVMHELAALGARIHVGYDAVHLTAADGAVPDTVIASSIAVPGNPEYDAAIAAGIPVLHRSQGLAAAMSGHRVLAIAGTHGKTTTSSMAAMSLTRAGAGPTFAVGAAVAGLGTNAAAGTGQWFIAEADESDGTLLNYRPEIAVVTNVEADHLDFYGTEEAVHQVFRDFALLLPPSGVLIVCADDDGAAALAGWVRNRHAQGAPAPRVATYGAEPGAGPHPGPDLQLVDDEPAVLPGGPGQRVTYRWADGRLTVVELAVPGRHNALNAAAVLLAAHHAGVDAEAAATGLAAFHGTARRFEFRGEDGGVRVFDDYAHHPTEVAAAIDAARTVADGHRVHVLFQPHLYSRTRDFAEGFARALSTADVVKVLPVYPAREEPLPGVDASLITDRLDDRAGTAGSTTAGTTAEAAVRELTAAARPGDVIVTMGAGDVTAIGPDLVAALRARKVGQP